MQRQRIHRPAHPRRAERRRPSRPRAALPLLTALTVLLLLVSTVAFSSAPRAVATPQATTPQPATAPAGLVPTLDRSQLAWVSCPRGAGAIGVAPHLAPRVRKLVRQALSDGVPLCGTGWRSYHRQRQLRLRNCGVSTKAVYHWPARWCTPPTAKPGSSMHEKGLAIDFRPLRGVSRKRMYRWLRANASKYGLYQLPSENWHYSTTGQ